MDDDKGVTHNLLKNLGDMCNYDLTNKIHSHDDPNAEEISTDVSPYVDTVSLYGKLQRYTNGVSILSLNAQCLPAKFNDISIFVEMLKNQGFEFSIICIQETWLTNNGTEQLYNLPNYQLEHVAAHASKHGGVAIYINDKYSYSIIDHGTKSNLWDGLFIELSGYNLSRKMILGNIYKPPGNYTNDNIETFIDEITPILAKLSKGKIECVLVGDFNIDLLKMNERNLYQRYFELFLSNGFLPRITYPTRITRRSGSLIEQIFHRNLNTDSKHIAGIILSSISDHLPYFLCINSDTEKQYNPTKIKITVSNEPALLKYEHHMKESNVFSKLSADPCSNPNSNYKTLNDELVNARTTHLPTKVVKFDKRKHKKSEWITPGIIKSISQRDKL